MPFEPKSKKEAAEFRKKGIALATTEGIKALVKKYDLPVEEAQIVFITAYASALAGTVGENADEMFGQPYKDFIGRKV